MPKQILSKRKVEHILNTGINRKSDRISSGVQIQLLFMQIVLFTVILTTIKTGRVVTLLFITDIFFITNLLTIKKMKLNSSHVQK